MAVERRRLASAALLAALLSTGPAIAQATDGGTIVYNTPLRICADPDDMPYSNKAGQGFENKLAEMAAKHLDTTVAYTWFAQRGGFISATLNAGECDVIMGVPNLNGVDSTRSYYRSSYVFVSRADRNLSFSSMTDPHLKHLKIGVPLIGADGTGTPPAIALGEEGIFDRVVGFPVYGNSSGTPPMAAPIEAVARGDIDIAAVWGPIGGYYASQAKVPLRVVPITDTTQFLPQMFEYPIAMAVRSGDTDLKDRLDGFIRTHRTEIAALLKSYGVPLL